MYNVKNTIKCKMCKYYYHASNVICQSSPKYKKCNSCKNCYKKIITIQRFIVKYMYNYKYSVCKRILDRKCDRLGIE